MSDSVSDSTQAMDLLLVVAVVTLLLLLVTLFGFLMVKEQMSAILDVLREIAEVTP